MKLKTNESYNIHIDVGVGTEGDITLQGKIRKDDQGNIVITPIGAITYPGGVRYDPEKTTHT